MFKRYLNLPGNTQHTQRLAVKLGAGYDLGYDQHCPAFNQEECDVLILVLSKNTEPIALSDFRAVMLATLRLASGISWQIAWPNTRPNTIYNNRQTLTTVYVGG